MKRVFITGGASGLGKALAERYARDKAKILIADIQEEKGKTVEEALKRAGAEAVFQRCDVRHESDLASVARWTEENWGGVDVVFNNAGVAVSGPIGDVSIEDWQWVMDINLMGVVRGCKVFAPILRRQKSGHIVNIASLAGLIHPPNMGPYNAAKAAVVALSETLHVELADDGVGVSVVCPSFFRTDLISTARCSSPELRQTALKMVTQARRGAEEVADTVVRGVENKVFRILPDVDGKVAWTIKRYLPFSVLGGLMKKDLAAAQRKAMRSR